MALLYSSIEFIFPFEFTEYDFIKNAIICLIIAAPIFGIIGSIILNNKMSFFSDALGHSAITGVAIGVVLGMMNYSISMLIFGIIFALILNIINKKTKASKDTIIAIMSSVSVAIGLLVMSKTGGVAKYSTYLVGDVLGITINEIKIFFIITLIIFIVSALSYNKIVASSTSVSISKTKGINTSLYENLFGIITAIIVMVTIKYIGILLINALFILPAAASRNISKNLRQYTIYSILITLVSSILGIAISYYMGVATGPMIVVIASIIFVMTFSFKRNN